MAEKKVRVTAAAAHLQNKPKTISTTKNSPQTSLVTSSKNAAQKLPDAKTKLKKPNDEVEDVKTVSKSKTKISTSMPMPSQTMRTKPSTISNRASLNSSVSQKSQPMRAKHSVEIMESIRKNTATVRAISAKVKPEQKPNAVLDTVHNVTVLSPPMRRQATPVNRSETISQPRPRTRTLADEEVVVLRRDSAKQRLADNIKKEEKQTKIETENPQVVAIKEPVAFEVKFEEANAKPSNNITEPDDDENYSDDFESYESDFESGSSSQNDSPNEDEEQNKPPDVAEEDKNDILDEEDEEESFITQCPVTVIQRDKDKDKDLERKLDSGNFDTNSRRYKFSEMSINSSQTMISSQFDSLETSEQMDSGISGSIVKDYESGNSATFYEGYAKFGTHPVVTPRGLKLMSKLQFDMLDFTLLEMKPMAYDLFMQTYGQLHTTQCSTQTNDNSTNAECQTDDLETRCKWTQHPPKYDLLTVQKMGSNLKTINNSCGEEEIVETKAKMLPLDEFEASALRLAELRRRGSHTLLSEFRERHRKPINLNKLSAFLRKSAELMSFVLHSIDKRNKTPDLKTTEFVALDTKFLNSLQVVRVFANSAYDIVVTVHESLPDVNVYTSDFAHLMVVWSTRANESRKPRRLLSTWNKICRVEICNNFSEIIVCGLVDGSLAMWDLRETHSFCSKLDGYLTHFTATQSIVPSWYKDTKITDLGAMIDVRSFKSHMKASPIWNSATGYRSVQLASLNESGIVTLWTLVETKTQLPPGKFMEKQKVVRAAQLEYSSPWARVKLIQSTIGNLREYLESRVLKTKSQFEKTVNIFQKEISNSKALQELVQSNSESREKALGIRFISIETGAEIIYVCTNQNYILSCSKSLKSECFRKITINESPLLFPTTLCVLSNEDFLAVGFSNGSVSIVNSNQRKFDYHSQTQSRPATTIPSRPSTESASADNGKSCAMQNLILNERRSIEPVEPVDYRPDTAACISMVTNKKKPFELRVFDQQVILDGNTLRKNLVRALALSSDGWRLFVLTNGSVRAYDFFLDKEVPTKLGTKVVDIATAKTQTDELHLIVLNTDSVVNLHNIQQ